MLKQILATLCGNDMIRLAKFSAAFPTSVSFQPALAAFGDLTTLAGFLRTRYRDDFARLRADLDKVGVDTLKLMVAGTGERRRSVSVAVEKARASIDLLLPPVAENEGAVVVKARRARVRIDELWANIPEFPTDAALREVVGAVKEAQAATALVARGVPEVENVDPEAKRAWKEKRQEVHAQCAILRTRIVAFRAAAPGGTDFGRVTRALATLVEAVKHLDAGSIDEPYLVHVQQQLGAALDLVKRERVNALLEGPFETLGDQLPDELGEALQALEDNPLEVPDTRLSELEKSVARAAAAFLKVDDHLWPLRERVEAVLRRRDVAGLPEQLAHLELLAKQKKWHDALKFIGTVERRVASTESKIAEKDQSVAEELAKFDAIIKKREQEDSAALAWGKSKFDGNTILKRVWNATHLNRKQLNENASIGGVHDWHDVETAIAVWRAQSAGSGVVSNVHVPGDEPQAKWEKDPSRKVAQANFICDWGKIRVDIHVTVELRSFLANSMRWTKQRLPPELEGFAPTG